MDKLKINYRVLWVDDNEGQIMVRYSTPFLSEEDLRSAPVDREAQDLYKFENAGKTDDDWWKDEEARDKYTKRVSAAGPARCRTDYLFNLWNPKITEKELHQMIVESAPRDWFNLMHQIKDQNVDTTFEVAKKLVGEVFSAEIALPKVR